MTEHINWAAHVPVSQGFVGQSPKHLFQITFEQVRPRGAQYLLDTTLPMTKLSGKDHQYPTEEAAKEGAERILAKFLADLGAQFKEEA